MKSNNGQKNGIIGGMFWSFSERILAQLVSTVVTIILARILSPSHYGIISIVTIFITICNVFVTSGFGNAVVRKKNATDLDFNTAFWISLILSIILYILLFIGSPFIEKFYAIKGLSLVIRIMGIRLPLSALNNIQQAYIQHEMKFKKFFIMTFFGTVISAVVGIVIALNGGGVWALVAQYLTNTIIDSAVLNFVGDWHPKWEFSYKSSKEIFHFGWKVLLTDLSYTIEADLRSLVIGKVFGASDLAYYDQGKKYPTFFVNNINSAVQKVMLPAFSNHQENIEKLKNMLRKAVRIGIFILAPILIGFAVVAPDFVSIILTDKWRDSTIYLQIFCFIYLTRPLETFCHQMLLALGRSDIVLLNMIIISCLGIATTLIAVFCFKSVLLIALGLLLSTFISLLLFMLSANRCVKYKFREQIVDVGSSILMCCLMAIVLITFNHFVTISSVFLLIIEVIIGAVSYILFSYLFKIDSLFYLCKLIKEKVVSIISSK